MTRTSAALAVPLALLALLVGCGTEQASPAHMLPDEGDRVPITQRAIGAIALTHLDDDTSDRRGMYTDRRHPKGLVGADLRYRAGPGEDGDLLRVAVAPGEPEVDPCEFNQCVELETGVEGATLLLRWQEEAPEADPGVVSVLLQRDGEYAYVYQAGPTITGDPRDLDLTVGIDQMTDVVEDPWLRLGTSPEVVEAGEQLEDWEG